MTFRVGLVGAGNISRVHVQALRRLGNVEIVGVTDLDTGRARAFAEAMSLRAWPSLDALYEAGARVIHVLTPPAAHTRVALRALELGCDLFIEKPLAVSAAECDQIDKMAALAGRQVCVGHSLLYDPFVRKALTLVKEGAIGDVLTFDYYRSANQQAYGAAALSGEQQSGGYPFRDIGIHALYLAEAFLGPILNVHASARPTGRGNCNLWVDEWRVLVEGERGSGQVHLSWNVRPQQNVIVVQGTAGIIRADLFGLSVTVKKQRPMPEHASRVLNAFGEAKAIATQNVANVIRVATGKLWQFHGIQALVAEFYASLADGRPAPVAAADAKRVVFWTEHVAEHADKLRAAWIQTETSHRCGAQVLVTGAGGFIGRHLTRRLIEDGTAVRLLVRRPPERELASHPLVEVVLGDLADPSVVDRAMSGITTVYHLGATMRGGALDFERGTIMATKNIIDSALRHGIDRVVYMSSLSVIDTDEGRNGIPVTENVTFEKRPHDRGLYTRTKSDAEALVRDAVSTRGLPAVILRPGEVVSPEKPLLTPGVAQKVASTLVVLGNGRVRLPLVHVTDVVDGAIAAARPSVPAGSVIQLVDGADITQNDIISHYRKTSGQRLRVLHVPLPVVLALAWVAEQLAKRLIGRAPIGPRRIRAATVQRSFDCSQAAALLGWSPRASVRSIMAPIPVEADPGMQPAPVGSGQFAEI